MDIRIDPRRLSGTVTPPASKSMAHRLIIAAALSGSVSTIHNVSTSKDIEATLRCMAAMGAGVEQTNSHTLCIHGLGHSVPQRCDAAQLPYFDCGESGSTLRFLIPIALTVAGGGVFTGQGRLMERPQQPYFDLFDEKGISYQLKNGVLTVQGRLTAGEYRLPGNVSSQFCAAFFKTSSEVFPMSFSTFILTSSLCFLSAISIPRENSALFSKRELDHAGPLPF